MPALRFPILLFRDGAGMYTATLVEDSGDIAAIADKPAEARSQLRDYLEWNQKHHPWFPAPDFIDPQLTILKVEVRPEYKGEKRSYPLREPIKLRVPLVNGKDSTGLLIGALPTLSIRFNYYEKDDLRPLAIGYVQAKLKGCTPEEVARYLPPTDFELEDIVIQVPHAPPEKPEKLELDALEAVAEPLGARELRTRYSRAWEREEQVGRLVETLKKEKAPVLLVGESGSGKTSILVDAVRRIEREGSALTPEQRLHEAAIDLLGIEAVKGQRVNRFWLTSAPRVIAGMKYLGMWQERVEQMIAQLGQIGGVLCVENLLDLVRTGGRSPTDSVAAFLIPYLARGEMRLVAEATPAELDAVRRLLPALADLFQIILVPPMDKARAVSALSQTASQQKTNLRIEIERGVVDLAYKLFARFAPYQSFPGKASGFVVDLFDRALRNKSASVTAADAIAQFIGQTGLPELFLRDEIPLPFDDVVKALHADVIGQENACRAAAGVITTFKAGLNDPNRPLGVLLFCGPTGVGKTQLAQSIAKYLYGASSSDARRMIRLDMSEYANLDAADRFLGSPQSGPAEWIQKIRQQPFTVLLLDEIEKASPDIFDILLGIFDEGRMTDAWGRLTYFRSAVIIMTSNLGAGIAEPFGLAKTAPAAYDSEAAGFFRPEFYNRIDSVVTFEPLTGEVVRKITEKELADLGQREGFAKANVKLTFGRRLIDHLAQIGFDARYGARPLQRAVEQTVVTALARWLIENADVRDATLNVDLGERGVEIARG